MLLKKERVGKNPRAMGLLAETKSSRMSPSMFITSFLLGGLNGGYTGMAVRREESVDRYRVYERYRSSELKLLLVLLFCQNEIKANFKFVKFVMNVPTLGLRGCGPRA